LPARLEIGDRVADRPATESVPAVATGARDELPDRFRVGYAENLRSAGMPELVGTALPGLGGIVLITAAGGLLGYRQAKAGHALLPAGARFLQ